ncbi:hypothetical protein LNAOJCKE_2022 [Methylorubrum aminovorans]|uniref:Apea-like HEPN domain-containing protein n=1 Tax=Methylorubrum aminovorans TaxID=269069 RepID=A0ABQ4UF96_9HYPH|nr:hypothetical protein [Methylorubrum aminovorans]GJE64815.1 hypothetical protein LNAOJCKE_2022 [Methylorubrum aminovorans]GMA75086.1 hypothetical protein GCM10025880_15030 [Methylorubrum aminovorans]
MKNFMDAVASKLSKSRISRFIYRKRVEEAAPDFRRKNIELRQGEEFKLLSSGRIDYDSLMDGFIKNKYSAIDPLWNCQASEGLSVINLREHMTLLWSASNEFAQVFEGWTIVSENLRLAASINDIFADTDLQGDSGWCAPAAEYESANSELSEKYLAGFIVFSLTWTAYEGAVDIISEYHKEIKQQRGARGREIILKLGENNSFPHIRNFVYMATGTRSAEDKFFKTPEMRRILRAGSLAGVAAEHLREFRNAVIHGDIRKPEPLDWGEGSKYIPDDDPGISQFYHNVRLLLIMIQILMIEEHRMNEIHTKWILDEDWSISTEDAIRSMHVKRPNTEQKELDLHVII